MVPEAESKRCPFLQPSNVPRSNRLKGINVPVLPGIMPIQTFSSFVRVTKLCGARIPVSMAGALKNISVGDTNLFALLKLAHH